VLQQPPLKFGLTVMVLGLSGVGKSATINSLLGRQQPEGYRETGRVEVVRGEVAGIPLTFIDTPGLEPSAGGHGAWARRGQHAVAGSGWRHACCLWPCCWCGVVHACWLRPGRWQCR